MKLDRQAFAPIALTLLAAWLAAQLCLWLRTPLPWMLGPLVVTALASALGQPTRSSDLLRNAGQWVIGAALGLYFTPQVGALVMNLWWAVLLGVVWALAQGYTFGAWLQWRHRADLGQLSPRSMRATTYFASAIGGASEMTLLSERAGARTDLVAASHTLRLLMVVLSVPFAMQWAQAHWGLHVDETLRMVNRTPQWPGLLWLALASGAGAMVMLAMRRANPWFMGALLASMGVTLMGLQWSAIPQGLTNAAQLVIGVSLGVKFRKDFIHTAPQWLVSVAIGTLAMMLGSALFAWALAWGTDLHVATLSLGTSPGGIAEMAITAKVLQLGVPVVTAFQVSRLVAVLLLVGPLFRLEERRIDRRIAAA
jgi:membrane AbrB-like protein